ncbi:ATPase [Candidatus Bathyarchaeota archaeon]|nr:MAG: ATPase [Candidatus Bathyarchaeota archaeon]
MQEIYIPDVSALECGVLPDLISQGKVRGKILVHQAVLRAIEEKARRGDFRGVRGLKALCRAAEQAQIPIEYVYDGTIEEPDPAVRSLASECNGTLITSDAISVRMAEAMGIKALYSRPPSYLKLDEFFDTDVMSVHLKEGVPPFVKRGKPGAWKYVQVDTRPLSRMELEAVIRDILEKVGETEGGFLEIIRDQSIIVQLNSYRIVITRPPLSDGIEITAVKPISKLTLEDYNPPAKLVKRLSERAEGILIAGAPGMGKTTFAQALVEFYKSKGKVVKTLESPRDMQLPPEVTQYSKNATSPREIYDVLLLSRPDYTVFDEMRDEKDFKLFADLRLAGVGMVGVIHATTPIDAVQRFIGKVELGLIPSIIDTVIFIDQGRLAKIYTLEMVVKTPQGLAKENLARPAVVIRDFMTGQAEYEIYVFGRRTFVVPLRTKNQRAVEVLERFAAKYFPEFRVEIFDREALILVPPEYLTLLPRRKLKKLNQIGKKLGLSVRVEPELSEAQYL